MIESPKRIPADVELGSRLGPSPQLESGQVGAMAWVWGLGRKLIATPPYPGESSIELRRWLPSGVSEGGKSFSFLPIWRASAGTFRTFVTIPTAQYLDLFETLGIMIPVTIVPLMLVRWFDLCTQSPRGGGEERRSFHLNTHPRPVTACQTLNHAASSQKLGCSTHGDTASSQEDWQPARGNNK